MRVAVAISPRAMSPADTEPRNIVARPVDSAIVAARAPWRVKCSVVTNVTAAGCGSAPPAPALAFASLPVVPPASTRWSQCDYRSRAGHPAGGHIWLRRLPPPRPATRSGSTGARSAPSAPRRGCPLAVPDRPGEPGPAGDTKLAEDLGRWYSTVLALMNSRAAIS